MKNRIYLITEFILLYIGMPGLFYFDIIPVPKIAALLGITLFCVLVLWFDDKNDFSHLFSKTVDYSIIKQLWWKGIVVAGVVIILVLTVEPSGLFAFPRERPVLWMVIMLLYPLLSALPQELIYREFFYQRYYGTFFTSEQALAVTSAVAFSFLHIIYDNWWAPLLALAGGLMFAHTYLKTKSLYWVSVEHAIYGCLVFTIGMGHYFYEPF